MDALSLLCTLHADGPATLRRLRLHGCGSLEALVAMGDEDLAGLLAVAPARARRILREARHLAQRVGEPSDREEAPEGLLHAHREGPEMTVDAGALDQRDRRLLDRVLQRWRTDEPAEPAHFGAPSPPEREPEPEPDGPSELAELGGEWASRLEAAGVRTFAELVAADAVQVAAATGRPFAEVRRLQFLAARRAPSPSPAAPSPAAPSTAAPSTAAKRPAPAAEGSPGAKKEAASRSEASPRADGGGTVLDWNFEIPSPPPSPEHEEASGPFA